MAPLAELRGDAHLERRAPGLIRIRKFLPASHPAGAGLTYIQRMKKSFLLLLGIVVTGAFVTGCASHEQSTTTSTGMSTQTYSK
jgi:hypothetical protein